MTIKAVIFDLDGTITKPFFDFDAIRRQMGLAEDAGPILEAMRKMDPEQRRRAKEILHFHEQQAVQKSSLNKGARETLEALHTADIRIGILTRNTRDNALAIARKHGLEFDATVDREDGPVKPDAFGVLQLCRQFGISPQQTLLVGDYLFDVLSAKAAGAVAVLLKNHKEAEQFAQHADFTIDSLEQILPIIKEKNKNDTIPSDV
jgi:HAD superfamily hydrolase (TIGR01509 family)